MQLKQSNLIIPSMVMVFACLLLPFFAHADPTDKTIVLALPSGGWPPYIIMGTKKAPASGIMPDVLCEVCRLHGYNLKLEYYPEKRCLMLLSEGRIDAYIKSRKWVKDASLYLWTDPVLQSTDVLVCRKDHHIQFSKEEDLAGLNIGVVHGYFYPTLHALFARNVIHKHQSTNTHNLLHMLEYKHVDAIVTNRKVAEWILQNDQKLDSTQFTFSQHALDTAPYSFTFTKKRKWLAFVRLFNTELQAMRTDGRLQAFFDRYR
ncbi:substrate-binding periplasmic protein [Pseudodesulfovibrio sediminis]|uniref:Solute-binding protein family 3/N-terminal domain-containing protein n=1 Tax=Pseudodesulfovibrio sediminis TaxID=2810563 RepID=A0ABM7P4M0_9BACT|nr:ABC transporter substrate-binding protein [Pseudodesulfovibrio sediminis]BCS87810.1 hypothetical protein PSDVSF_10520 [Pseudodesulfovibrio sediminis]